MITVIIPVYNDALYLQECIESIIGQKYEDWELILVDDHSGDNSLEICKSYSNENIFAYENPDKGVSSARNFGISKARGDYIVFVDSDDILPTNALSYLEYGLRNVDFCMASYTSFDNEKEIYHNIEDFSGTIMDFCKVIYSYILRPSLQGPCWKIFQKKIIIDNDIHFPISMSYGEDAWFVYDYLLHSESVNVINQSVYKYRIAKKSLSHGFRKEKYYTNIKLIDKVDNLCKKNNVDSIELKYEYIRDSFSSYCFEAANELSYQEAKNVIKEAAVNVATMDAYGIRHLPTKKRIIQILLNLHCYSILILVEKINFMKNRIFQICQ